MRSYRGANTLAPIHRATNAYKGAALRLEHSPRYPLSATSARQGHAAPPARSPPSPATLDPLHLTTSDLCCNYFVIFVIKLSHIVTLQPHGNVVA